jgi:hypothetical protein
MYLGLLTWHWSMLTYLGNILPCLESLTQCLLSLLLYVQRDLSWSWRNLTFLGSINVFGACQHVFWAYYHVWRHVNMSGEHINMYCDLHLHFTEYSLLSMLNENSPYHESILPTRVGSLASCLERLCILN